MHRLQSITLLAAQTDFTEAGELTLFINASQVAFLEDMMWERGVLDTTQMAGAFQLLRSNDLVWSRLVHDYLMGERDAPSDLMSWNADATRLPFRMHSEYLRQLFLDNDLAERPLSGRGQADLALGHPHPDVRGRHAARSRRAVALDLQDPLPGRCRVTYLLTSGGHNAGIVSPPGEDHRHYQVLTKGADARYIGPDDWLTRRRAAEGSWWPEWLRWLEARSGDKRAPPPLGRRGEGDPELVDAPGSYVLQR